jgi:hypothetical protein
MTVYGYMYYLRYKGRAMTPTIFEELWEYSPAKGSSLLLLLAIARHANHDGTGAYPSLATLKRLTRLSHSQVCLLLRQLAEEGHLSVTHGGGPGGTNAYTIVRTWDTEAHPNIGHAKTAYAEGRAKFGHNQEPKRKKDPVPSSDVRSSDCQEEPHPTVTPAAANWLRTIAQDLGADFAQVLQGTQPQDSPPQTQPPRTPRGAGLYRLGKLCKRGHEHEGTGQSLRRLPSGSCLQCDLARQEAKRQARVQASRAAKPARRIIDLAAHRQKQG